MSWTRTDKDRREQETRTGLHWPPKMKTQWPHVGEALTAEDEEEATDGDGCDEWAGGRTGVLPPVLSRLSPGGAPWDIEMVSGGEGCWVRLMGLPRLTWIEGALGLPTRELEFALWTVCAF